MPDHRKMQVRLYGRKAMFLQYGLTSLLCPMVVLALVLLVVGKYSASMPVTCLGHQTVGGCFSDQFGTKYGVVFATFCQWRIYGYKNGTFSASLLCTDISC
jgi:hypothetical protein